VSGDPRVLIVGAAGQLGVELQQCFADHTEVVAADRALIDLAAPDRVRRFIRSVQPDVILNAGAYTAVDRAEQEPELAQAVNGRAPGIMAEETLRRNALLVHYSTDYVFDGSKDGPWTETDTPHPLNVYGATKLAGEEAIRGVGGRCLIFRTSWVYSAQGKNFLLTMLRLAGERDTLNVVDDQFGAPTSAAELAHATRAIVDGVLAGRFAGSDLYHMTCSGATSWYGFAQAIFARAGTLLHERLPGVMPIASADYPAEARRPRNSVLSNEKLREHFGIGLAPWETALDEVIAQLQYGG